jgi:cell division protease FtsH
MSDETAKLIDEEVRRLIENGESEARRIITDNADKFEAIAQALLEFETLTGDELRDLMNGKRPTRDIDSDTTAAPRSSAVPPTPKPRRAEDGEPEAGVPQPG